MEFLGIAYYTTAFGNDLDICEVEFRTMWRSSHHGAVEMNPTRNHEVLGSILGLTQWAKDLALLWFWRRPASVAQIRPIAWEPPYAEGISLKSKQQQQQNHVEWCFSESVMEQCP